MRPHLYRLTVLVCAVSWLLVGLHLPGLHQMTHHGRALAWPVIGAMTLVALAAIATLWMLLRAPAPRTR